MTMFNLKPRSLAADDIAGYSATSRQKMVQLEKISVSYDGKVAVSNVSFNIYAGEVVSFLGASGCGKSTILNVIAGFVSPTAGYAFVAEKEITAPGPDRAV